MTTEDEPVPLAEALRHGEAVHIHDYPLRIRGNIPEVGVPVLDWTGGFRRDEKGLILTWEPLTQEYALDRWPLGGWLLCQNRE